MKILITGAAGFIGSHLTEALLQAGHEVIGIDNLNDHYAPAIKRHNAGQITAAGAQLIEIDLVQDDLRPYVEGVEVVYHSAAQPGISNTTPFGRYLDNNIRATHHLLDALQSQSSLQLFVNVGTSSIYGAMATAAEDTVPMPISWYGTTKLAAEQLALARFRETGFPATSFRLFSVYGARERPDKLYPRLIHSIIDGVPFPLYADSWHHSRSFTFVGDIVKAFVKALDTDKILGEIINIGTTDSLTTGEAIEIVEGLLNRKANYIEMPPRKGDQKATAAVIEKAEKLLGYHPDTPFAEGIKSEIEWFQSLPDALRPYFSPPL